MCKLNIAIGMWEHCVVVPLNDIEITGTEDSERCYKLSEIYILTQCLI